MEPRLSVSEKTPLNFSKYLPLYYGLLPDYYIAMPAVQYLICLLVILLCLKITWITRRALPLTRVRSRWNFWMNAIFVEWTPCPQNLGLREKPGSSIWGVSLVFPGSWTVLCWVPATCKPLVFLCSSPKHLDVVLLDLALIVLPDQRGWVNKRFPIEILSLSFPVAKVTDWTYLCASGHVKQLLHLAKNRLSFAEGAPHAGLSLGWPLLVYSWLVYSSTHFPEGPESRRPESSLHGKASLKSFHVRW